MTHTDELALSYTDAEAETEIENVTITGMQNLRRFGWEVEEIAFLFACSEEQVLACLRDAPARPAGGETHGA